MSASPAQLAANRANAQHSTGPRTPAGKAASARNAPSGYPLAGDAYAADDTILAAPTSPAAGLLAAYTAEYAPHGPAETTVVQRLAVLTAHLDLLGRAFDALPA